ncbi:MAG: cytochrome-c oxidase, cbb3-type subunit III [Aquamicrobium sp.]|uniref:cytochrome-c oxidase, cbb3-type subunit III n=1 Tax=Aquamicrobium sp. TaxID=1872579 RepID=UPI00349EA900|nr:cytochrome-c oxidase, cbb3-type subunit III [Aquamicrobium sp.]
MARERHDPVTGQMTTGHEWNGIEELDTPIPRVALFFLVTTALFALGYWILMPAWPLGVTYTRGLLGFDQREVVTRQVDEAAAARANWVERVMALDYAEIRADAALMEIVNEAGHALFGDNCAVCHGTAGTGGPGFPDLAAGAWLWGGDAGTIHETIRVGINSGHDETRMSQMMAFGRDGVLERDEVRAVAAYVRSLSGQDLSATEAARRGAGEEIFAENCASCHGEDATGMVELGAPNLADDVWIYGGDAQSVQASIHGGRQGHMPHWEGRLKPLDLKVLALYVGSLAAGGAGGEE